MREILVRLDDPVAERLRALATAEGLSESSWIARRIEQTLASLWPEELCALAGAWRGSGIEPPTALRARRSDDRRRHALLSAQGGRRST